MAVVRVDPPPPDVSPQYRHGLSTATSAFATATAVRGRFIPFDGSPMHP